MVWLNVIRRDVKLLILSDRGINLRVTLRVGPTITTFFYCDSDGVVYLITCKKCGLQYVGNTVTSFRLRFNNHKSSMMRYGKGQRGMGGQRLYAHFYTEGLMDLEIQVEIHVSRPNERESFWIEKLNTYCPRGLNIREED